VINYDAAQVLHRVNDHVILTVALGGLALVCNFVYFYEAWRCAERDRCAPLALFATTLFAAHDGNYLIDAHRWFATYGSWFPELFWFALIVTFAFELAFIRQTVRYGREELAPRLSQRAYSAYVLAAIVATCALWAVVKQVIVDPLYLTSFTITIAVCLPSATSMMLRRGGARGQSPRQYLAFTGMAAAWFACNMLVFGPAFKGLALMLLFVLTIVWGAAITYALHRVTPARADGALRQQVVS
jgi:hypothetical protein